MSALILDDFYRACDRAKVFDGETGDTDQEVIRGLIRLLTAYYNRGSTPERRDENARMFVSDFAQRKFNARSCVRGLRKAPSIFAQAPTLGGLHALIRGEDIGYWPPGWLVEAAPKPEQTHPNAPREPRPAPEYRDWTDPAGGAA